MASQAEIRGFKPRPTPLIYLKSTYAITYEIYHRKGKGKHPAQACIAFQFYCMCDAFT